MDCIPGYYGDISMVEGYTISISLPNTFSYFRTKLARIAFTMMYEALKTLLLTKIDMEIWIQGGVMNIAEKANKELGLKYLLR